MKIEKIILMNVSCFSTSKYSHDSPWPAFTETLHHDSVSKVQEKPGALKVSIDFFILCCFSVSDILPMCSFRLVVANVEMDWVMNLLEMGPRGNQDFEYSVIQ